MDNHLLGWFTYKLGFIRIDTKYVRLDIRGKLEQKSLYD